MKSTRARRKDFQLRPISLKSLNNQELPISWPKLAQTPPEEADPEFQAIQLGRRLPSRTSQLKVNGHIQGAPEV